MEKIQGNPNNKKKKYLNDRKMPNHQPVPQKKNLHELHFIYKAQKRATSERWGPRIPEAPRSREADKIRDQRTIENH